MIMLLSNPSLRSNPSLHKWLGHLATPQKIGKVREPVWAADNGCFLGFNEGLFTKMLEKCRDFHKPKFIVAPDKVADHSETLRLFGIWEPTIHLFGYPCAFVLQDGATRETVPWANFESLFIGGSTDFKLSREAKKISEEAKSKGKWLHMGRVNSVRRISYAKSIGCDSCDGSGMAKFFDAKVPRFVNWLEHDKKQIKLNL